MNDNKLIAEFMGWNTTDCDEVFTEPSGMMDTYTTAEMQFQKSWDWLMPVVQKCYESGAEGDCIGDITMYLTDVDIKSTYKAVVEFINQYNNDTI